MRHRRPACQSSRTIRRFMLLGLAAGLLGGCETSGGPSNPVSELVAYSSGAQASTRGAERPDAPKVAEKSKSRAQAAMDCWAMVEKSRAGASLESRADFVNKCIDDKLKPSDGGSAAKSDAKPDAKPAATPKPRQRADAKPAS